MINGEKREGTAKHWAKMKTAIVMRKTMKVANHIIIERHRAILVVAVRVPTIMRAV
jgi:hypothetical protein